MCSHVSRGFLLVLILLLLLVLVLLLVLGVKVLTTDVEELLHLQDIPRAFKGVASEEIIMRRQQEKVYSVNTRNLLKKNLKSRKKDKGERT